jgi:hypothetical protein
MPRASTAFAALSIATFAFGCGLSEIRNIHEPITLSAGSVPETLEDCDSGRAKEELLEGAHNSIEDYGRYLIAYAEFDDQGWTTGTTGTGSQVQALMAGLEKEIARGTNLLILVFVHGWHHNAYTNDCNVRQFRVMVRLASDALGSSQPPRKVVGVYVAWRGESVAAPILNATTFYGRKLAAERVAKGSVRELFARLKLFETKNRTTRIDPRVRTVIVGHSFGGLIAFHSLSQSLLESIVFGQTTCEDVLKEGRPGVVVNTEKEDDTLKWDYPDLVVLINPAFEATRYDPLYQASLLRDGCIWSKQTRPRMITIAADNDRATGITFPAARWVATALDSYNGQHREEERSSNLNVIGFIERYRTHRLKTCRVNGETQVVMTKDFGDSSHRPDLNTPLFVARAAPDILDGHSGFLYSSTGRLAPALFRFVIRFYQYGVESIPGCEQ